MQREPENEGVPAEEGIPLHECLQLRTLRGGAVLSCEYPVRVVRDLSRQNLGRVEIHRAFMIAAET